MDEYVDYKFDFNLRIVQIAFLLPFLFTIFISPFDLEETTRRAIMLSLFFLGVFAVVVEPWLKLPKSPVMLLLACTNWSLLSYLDESTFFSELNVELQSCANVLFFLLPAMAIVEAVKDFSGFVVIVNAILLFSRGSWNLLPYVLAILTFLLSAVMDNMTSTIVMLNLLKLLLRTEDESSDDRRSNSGVLDQSKKLKKRYERKILDIRKLLGVIVVIAANTGGAWSAIGDFTTTILWVEGKISPRRVLQSLLLPSIVNLFTCLHFLRKAIGRHVRELTVIHEELEQHFHHYLGEVSQVLGESHGYNKIPVKEPEDLERVRLTLQSLPQLTAERPKVSITSLLVFILGIGSLCLVPIFKFFIRLPPFLGVFLSFSLLWLLLLLVFRKDSMDASLARVDLSGFFFLGGILLAVGALAQSGSLKIVASFLRNYVKNDFLVCYILGLISALIDNVPLVQAVIEMFEREKDDRLWHLLALCGGTGGSILIFGSVAGVTLLNMERSINFIWYLRNVAPAALCGYTLSVLVYVAQPWAS